MKAPVPTPGSPRSEAIVRLACHGCGEKIVWCPSVARRNVADLRRSGQLRGNQVKIPCPNCGHVTWARIPGFGTDLGGLVR